jgi:hypothetical protein
LFSTSFFVWWQAEEEEENEDPDAPEPEGADDDDHGKFDDLLKSEENDGCRIAFGSRAKLGRRAGPKVPRSALATAAAINFQGWSIQRNQVWGRLE